MNTQTKVVLPAWIFEQAQGDKDEIKRLVLEYMKRYDGYRVIKVSKRLAICETNRI
ncbi:hypothetical protein M2M59_03870 [Rummeliibacillus sp. G93]|uniref:hypothetical protein n=1 Tax=unclassified Rummeliibacillus TaxID=2622809 RepID=UPI00201BD1CF|nr:hypothetical protein [Rummeliibacillus sp. G93]UQW98155.1 hypothetical protein M2M59_03870 [Rummeliibacillus sp. G93]